MTGIIFLPLSEDSESLRHRASTMSAVALMTICCSVISRETSVSYSDLVWLVRVTHEYHDTALVLTVVPAFPSMSFLKGSLALWAINHSPHQIDCDTISIKEVISSKTIFQNIEPEVLTDQGT